MRKLLFLGFFTILISYQTKATHIVGGEFQLVEQRAGLYDVFLNLYFDRVNGNPQAKDQSLTAYIYRKSDNVVMEILNMRLQGETNVAYNNPDCTIPEVQTSKITYAVNGGYQFTVNYDDPQGYYIAWDRCCRNDDIVNIETPGDVGMLFYLHFPRIFDDNGDLTGWSSPVFNPIPGTYACVNEPFYLDFGATDVDGDNLVFSLSRPLIGNSSANDPIPAGVFPEPYPLVTWKAGFNINNVIPGFPALKVNASTGLLTMTPSASGLYVFSVTCEEFRNGVKIGEVKRDFQIFVYDDCDPNDPPSASLGLPNGSIYDEINGDTVVIYSENIFCLDLFITDDLDNNNNEKITVKVIPVNFESQAILVEEGDDKFVSGPGDTLTGWKICPPDCEDIQDDPFIYDIIVSDDGCPLPKSDTIRLYIALVPEPNEPPNLFGEVVGNQNGVNIDEKVITLNVFEVDTVEIDFEGLDLDSTDLLTLSAQAINFKFKDFGMEFPTIEGTNGIVNGTFKWILDCDYFENTKKDEFEILFILDDNSCYKNNPDTIKVVIKITHEVDVKDFTMYNIFTPNGDNKNDDFIVNNLPRDKCSDTYVGFRIYNRWGRCVYQTGDRQIIWDGDELNDGVYYYTVEYSNSSYKGWFNLMR